MQVQQSAPGLEDFKFEEFFQEIQDIFLQNTMNAYDIIHKELKVKIGKDNELNQYVIKSKEITNKNVMNALDKIESCTLANYFSEKQEKNSQKKSQKSAEILHQEISNEFNICENNNQKRIASYLENQIVSTLQDTFHKQDDTLRQITTEKYSRLQKTLLQQNLTLEKTSEFLKQIQKK